jgi:AcrR family transcriptional regulator
VAGRHRDPDLEKRLLAAGWSLLQRRGYRALTLSQVAKQAQAHRSDVYRRWASKALLVVDVLAEHLPPISNVDTGTLLSDLRALLDNLAAGWSSLWIDGLVGLAADLQHDPDAELAFREMVVRRGEPVRNVITRAIERGEIRELPDLALFGNVLEGPLIHRRVVGRQLLTPDFLDAVALLAHGVLTGTAVRRP